MNIEQKLTATVIAALNALYGQEVPEKMVQLQKTKKEFEGHLTLVVFPFLKMTFSPSLSIEKRKKDTNKPHGIIPAGLFFKSAFVR